MECYFNISVHDPKYYRHITYIIHRSSQKLWQKKRKQNIRQVCALMSVLFVRRYIWASSAALCLLTVLSLYCMRWHKLVWEIPIKHCCRENRRLFCTYLYRYIIYNMEYYIENQKGHTNHGRHVGVVNSNYVWDMQPNIKLRALFLFELYWNKVLTRKFTCKWIISTIPFVNGAYKVT